MKRTPLLLAIVYIVMSLFVEAAAMVVFHLKVPQHNGILAPIVLTIPPLLVPLICGYRKLRDILTIGICLSALTLILTVSFARITHVSTGLIEPIIVRGLAGLLAGIVFARMNRSVASQNAGAGSR